MVVRTGKFILMCFGNLVWPGLGNLLIGNPVGWITSPIMAATHELVRRMEELRRGLASLKVLWGSQR
jgi:hypothetical protein